MNHDVHHPGLASRQVSQESARPSSKTPGLLSQLRNLSSGSGTLGSLFNSNTVTPQPTPTIVTALPAFSSLQFYEGEGADMHASSRSISGFVKGGNRASVLLDGGTTPTPTRPSTPHRRFPGVKTLLSGLASRAARSTQPVYINVKQTQVHTEEMAQTADMLDHGQVLEITIPDDIASLSDEFNHLNLRLDTGSRVDSLEPSLTPSTSYDSSELDETPPLTPESMTSDISIVPREVELLDAYYGDFEEDLADGGFHNLEEIVEEASYMHRHSMEIKEGKKPERAVNYEPLVEDLESPNLDSSVSVVEAHPADASEWYGLEYALELSKRERRASEVPAASDSSIGEYSKSRESWAAIHQGSIHPFLEEEEYHQWQNWHHYLEHQGQKRLHRLGRTFKAQANDLAWIYADQIRAMDLMAWQKETYGRVDKGLLTQFKRLKQQRPASRIALGLHSLLIPTRTHIIRLNDMNKKSDGIQEDTAPSAHYVNCVVQWIVQELDRTEYPED
ncbi:unnamed protein product [Mycena citricolor]|uniref:Uncharacterized protein n=1 Tax=Mycena citricolor TaxID=2018698 RepID=A0AAD2GSJ6_9AGAR|nr:unnamed protein product [Mycena citricolor]